MGLDIEGLSYGSDMGPDVARPSYGSNGQALHGRGDLQGYILV